MIGISVRPATTDDCRRYWEWANDPVVRAASFTTAPIPWEQHVKWFGARLAERVPLYVVVGDGGALLGQVRFDPQPDGAFAVGISLDVAARGRGWAAPALRAGCDALRRDRPSALIVAYVRAENAPSLSAFVRAGFRSTGSVRVHDCDAVRLELAPCR